MERTIARLSCLWDFSLVFTSKRLYQPLEMKAKAEMCEYACCLVVVSAHVLVKTAFILRVCGQPCVQHVIELQAPGFMKAVLLKCRLLQGPWVILKLGA